MLIIILIPHPWCIWNCQKDLDVEAELRLEPRCRRMSRLSANASAAFPQRANWLTLVHFCHSLWCESHLMFLIKNREIGTDPERLKKFVLVFQKWILICIYCIWWSSLTYLYLQKEITSAWTNQCWVLLASSWAFSAKQIASLPSLCLSTVNKTVEIWIWVFLPLLTPASFLFKK